MSRPAWKMPYISPVLFKNKFMKKNKTLLVKCRNSMIPAIFTTSKINVQIFNGVWHLSKLMQPNMLGCKFGEFAFTKRADKQTHLRKKVKKKPKGKK